MNPDLAAMSPNQVPMKQPQTVPQLLRPPPALDPDCRLTADLDATAILGPEAPIWGPRAALQVLDKPWPGPTRVTQSQWSKKEAHRKIPQGSCSSCQELRRARNQIT